VHDLTLTLSLVLTAHESLVIPKITNWNISVSSHCLDLGQLYLNSFQGWYSVYFLVTTVCRLALRSTGPPYEADNGEPFFHKCG